MSCFQRLLRSHLKKESEPESEDHVQLIGLGNNRSNPPRRIQKLTVPESLPIELPESLPLELPESFPRFGPLYSGDEPIFSSMKNDAWEIVLSRSGDQDPLRTRENFMVAMGRIEREAKDSYANGAQLDDGLTGSQFKEMMIRDGCFFIHLAFLFLGAQEHLGYDSNHGVFGDTRSSKDAKLFKRGMLLVGNQIPAVVLRELMNQEYFRHVTSQARLDEAPPPRGLFRRALYELLLLSHEQQFDNNDNNNNNSLPVDLLHCLQCLVLAGSSGTMTEYSVDDLDFQLIINIEDGENTSRRRFLTAVEMKEVGIGFKPQYHGVRGIEFTSSIIFKASLHLPVLTVDDDVELVFKSLIEYENSHERSSNEVCSYLRLMTDMIRTPEDTNILADQNILNFDDGLRHKEMFPEILNRLKCKKQPITQDLYTIRLLTSNYSLPVLRKILNQFLSVILILTVVQTVYTALSYHKSNNDSSNHEHSPPPPFNKKFA